MEKSELEHYRAILLEEKKHLQNEIDELMDRNLSETMSETSGEHNYESHLADNATATFERERDLSLEHNVEDIMKRVDAALQRIDSNDFGICQRCGRPISSERLKALPYADLCITCKEKEEKSW